MNIRDLPEGTAPKALSFDHFPASFQAVIWRNWNLVPCGRIAAVLGAGAARIQQAAAQLGLEACDDSRVSLWQSRGYITIIRRNWELLPYEQLLELLDWSAEKLSFTLKEDDFLWHKLGGGKPCCPVVRYRELTPDEQKRTRAINHLMQRHLQRMQPRAAHPFDFLGHYGRRQAEPPGSGSDHGGLRLIYSYSAVYGDPLLSDVLSPYPDGLLSDYAAGGVNAVWLQGTLYTLVPWLGENEPYSDGWRRRQENLRGLCRRAGQYGIKVFLYLNEPRNMPHDFFARHPEWQGSRFARMSAMCTSSRSMLRALENGVERLFGAVPELGGAFSITMSENLSHCLSKFENNCPHCAERSATDVIAEINSAIETGMHRAAPNARFIAWNWGWNPAWTSRVIESLPAGATVMATSETALPTHCLGVDGKVSDYSISKPGPGDFARRTWNSAREHGLNIMAKVQLNNTWEMSAVPYIPVPDLVEEHLENLRRAGVGDLMLSWTLGGYPGGNLELLNSSRQELAQRKFGGRAAPYILRAWTAFSEAFRNFPINGASALYTGPQNFGPASLLWLTPTGRRATMLGFPYDSLERWRGNHYPEEVFEEAFALISQGWREGLRILRRAAAMIGGEHDAAYTDLLNVSETVYCHFRSAYLQIRFVRKRNGHCYDELPGIIEEELLLARKMLEIVRRDSRIGFEASNHYYYTENDFKEKILNCELLKSTLEHNPSNQPLCGATVTE